jgi:hypothetical protein
VATFDTLSFIDYIHEAYIYIGNALYIAQNTHKHTCMYIYIHIYIYIYMNALYNVYIYIYINVMLCTLLRMRLFHIPINASDT